MGFWDLFRSNKPSKDMVKNNLRGKALEKEGNIDAAIILYEYNVEHRFDGSHPYKRLAIIYRRQKEFSKEIDVLNKALDVFTNDVSKSRPDRDNKIEEFNDRLVKAIELSKGKSPSSDARKTSEKVISENPGTKNRKDIPGSVIDTEQRIQASVEYRNRIYKMYYSDYPIKPFISKDREKNTNWIDQTKLFPSQSIVPKSMMTRFSDGLLPGHIYMLYWIDKIHRKRIPVYFEYEFGIDFEKEKLFLQENGYLDNDNHVTEKGHQAISSHYDVIQNKK